jgi:hypothetical protein
MPLHYSIGIKSLNLIHKPEKPHVPASIAKTAGAGSFSARIYVNLVTPCHTFGSHHEMKMKTHTI